MLKLLQVWLDIYPKSSLPAASKLIRHERVTKTDYIPELSEVRMVRRAPERPFDFSEDDRDYIGRCLAEVQSAFGLRDFAGMTVDRIPGRALIQHFIDWWRSLEPVNEAQQEAHGRLPAAIRLLDTVSSWMEEREQRKGPAS
jgi:hypothetical protein